METSEALWNRAKPLNGTDPASLYLRNRGIDLVRFPASLRYVEELESWSRDVDASGKYQWILEGAFPAMVAKVVGVSEKLVTVHRTYLTPTGFKAPIEAPKKLMKLPENVTVNGAAIRLCSHRDTIALAEGIETALAYHLLTAIPVWATVTAQGLETVELPREIQNVYICVDLDRSGRGEQASLKLAERLLLEGRSIYKAAPADGISASAKSIDWLDVLVRQQDEHNTKSESRPSVRPE